MTTLIGYKKKVVLSRKGSTARIGHLISTTHEGKLALIFVTQNKLPTT